MKYFLGIAALLLGAAIVSFVAAQNNFSPVIIAGFTPAGVAPSGNPVLVGGSDGTLTRTIDTSPNGSISVATGVAGADAVANTNQAQGQFWAANTGTTVAGAMSNYVFDGTNWDRFRSASLASFPTSVTLTARNAIGAALVEKGSRWSVVSNPASGSQATASIAAEANVRHVVDCIDFSGIASAATAAAEIAVNVRDGATGAGTIIWTHETGAGVLGAGGLFGGTPALVCGLNLVGTTNTAMTLEFAAGLTGLIESVSISGYNVN